VKVKYELVHDFEFNYQPFCNLISISKSQDQVINVQINKDHFIMLVNRHLNMLYDQYINKSI